MTTGVSPEKRFAVDPATRLHPGADGRTAAVLVGGSPLRMFRLTRSGRERVQSILASDGTAATPLVDRLVDAGVIHPAPRLATERLTETTVVIITCNGESSRLQRLVAACVSAVAHVLVIDDGSQPPIPRTACAGADVVRHDTRGGPATARRTGLTASTTAFVAFIDDDVNLDAARTNHGGHALDRRGDGAAWLATLLGHFDDDQVAAVAPRVRSAPPDTDAASSCHTDCGSEDTGATTRRHRASRTLATYEVAHSPLDLGDLPAIVRRGSRVSYLPAAVIVMRRTAISSTGGFDPAMRYGEDVDAVWRLVEEGWRCRYEPGVIVEHIPRATWGAWASQRFGYGTSAAPLAERHDDAVAPVRMNGWSAAVWLLILCRRPAAAFGLAASTAVMLDRRMPGLGRREAARIVTLGHLHAGRLVGAAMRRVWWPAGIAMCRSRRARWLAAAALASLFFDRPTRVRHAPLRLVDDLCYGAGVWRGVIARRHAGPLIPAVAPWPTRPSD